MSFHIKITKCQAFCILTVDLNPNLHKRPFRISFFEDVMDVDMDERTQKF